MSDKSHSGEDIAGLFAAFGGDAARYQEFKPAAEPATDPSWALFQAVPPITPPAPSAPAPLPTATPAASTLAPAQPQPGVAGPAAQRPMESLLPRLAQTPAVDPSARTEPIFTPPQRTPASAATPRASSSTEKAASPLPESQGVAPLDQAPAGTPLAALFERLANAPQTDGAAGSSLMAHWRQSN